MVLVLSKVPDEIVSGQYLAGAPQTGVHGRRCD